MQIVNLYITLYYFYFETTLNVDKVRLVQKHDIYRDWYGNLGKK